jgi:hypothetical protein
MDAILLISLKIYAWTTALLLILGSFGLAMTLGKISEKTSQSNEQKHRAELDHVRGTDNYHEAWARINLESKAETRRTEEAVLKRLSPVLPVMSSVLNLSVFLSLLLISSGIQPSGTSILPPFADLLAASMVCLILGPILLYIRLRS